MALIGQEASEEKIFEIEDDNMLSLLKPWFVGIWLKARISSMNNLDPFGQCVERYMSATMRNAHEKHVQADDYDNRNTLNTLFFTF